MIQYGTRQSEGDASLEGPRVLGTSDPRADRYCQMVGVRGEPQRGYSVP